MALLFLTWLKNRSFQNTDFRHLWNSSHDLIPVTDEPTKIVTIEFDGKQVLQRTRHTMFDVGAEVFMHHKQYLATPDIPMVGIASVSL